MALEITAKRLDALGNPSRLAIFRYLVRAGEPGLPVGEIAERTGIANSTLSHHLRRLVSVGLVNQRREGTSLFCSVSFEVMNETMEFLLRECCAEVSPAMEGHSATHLHDLAKHQPALASSPAASSPMLEENAQ